VLDPNMIDAASTHNPTFTGKVTCNNFESTGLTTLRDFSASGFVALPVNAVAIESVAGLTFNLGQKANLAGPTTFSGTTSLQNLAASGSVTLPNDSLTVANTVGLAGALAGKATLGGPANFSSCALTGSLTFGGNITGGSNSTINCFQVNSSGGFNSTTGSMSFAANVSQTIYTFASGNVQRGFVVVEAPSPNNSTTLAFFDSIAGNTFVTILARQGNAVGSTNTTSTATGTFNMNLFCNTSGNLRLSLTNAGTASWSIIFI
jgi:hypothetical protein